MHNPFRPGGRIRDPDKFAGREKFVIAAYRNIRRGRHTMIAGEKGLGKTSIAEQLQLLLAEAPSAVERFRVPLDPLGNILSIELSYTDSDFQQLLHRLGQMLEKHTGISASRKSYTKKTTLGIKGFIDSETSEHRVERFGDNARDSFLEYLGDLREKSQSFRDKGALVILDECDQAIRENEKWGVWMKALIEGLHSRGVENLVFLLIGKDGTYGMLLQQHDSLQRMIQEIQLPPMNSAEIVELCKRALHGTGIEFHSTVLLSIADLSSGHPYSAHIIGEQLFDHAVEELGDASSRKRGSVEKQEDGSYRMEVPTTGRGCVMPYQLNYVVRDVVMRVYSREYSLFSAGLLNANVCRVVEAAASVKNHRFSVDELIAVTGLREDIVHDAVNQLMVSKTLRRNDLLLEFVDQLLRMKIRMVAESNRLEAEVVRHMKAHSIGSLTRSDIQKVEVKSDKDLDLKNILLSELMIEQFKARNP